MIQCWCLSGSLSTGGNDDIPVITGAHELVEPSVTFNGKPESHAPHEGSASPNLTGKSVLLSWISSIFFHIMLLGAMYLLVFPYSPPRPEVEHAVTFAQVVGDVDATGTAPVPPSPAPPTSAPPSQQADNSSVRKLQPSLSPLDSLVGGPVGSPSGAASQTSGGLGGLTVPGVPVIGLGAGSPGSGGESGPPGVSLGTGGNVNFFGLQSAAPGVRSIVYVVDRSGSMTDTFTAVRAELKRSIGALRRSQKFHVIFYNSGEPLENPPLKPVPAIETNKRAFFEFLEGITATGGTRPERALRQALALEPDLIYFLSDGAFEPEVVDRLKEWNRDGRTKVYTIAYLDQQGRKLLEKIARENGGEFRFVTEHDLP